MANDKPRRPYAKTKTKSNWTRTAAGFGSDGFEDQDEFQAKGCGVRGPIKRVSVDPNRGVSLGKREGLHLGAANQGEPSDSEFKDVGE